jgi:hypothetical protein
MGIDVYVYDDAMAPLSAQIEVFESDDTGTIVDKGQSSKLGPSEYGVRLKLPKPPTPVTVWLDDLSGKYAATSMGHLNGRLSTRLDVALYPLPTGPSGPGRGGMVSSLSEAEPYITNQVRTAEWNESEANGVRGLVVATVRIRLLISPAGIIADKKIRWENTLRKLGINIVPGAHAVAMT